MNGPVPAELYVMCGVRRQEMGFQYVRDHRLLSSGIRHRVCTLVDMGQRSAFGIELPPRRDTSREYGRLLLPSENGACGPKYSASLPNTVFSHLPL